MHTSDTLKWTLTHKLWVLSPTPFHHSLCVNLSRNLQSGQIIIWQAPFWGMKNYAISFPPTVCHRAEHTMETHRLTRSFFLWHCNKITSFRLNLSWPLLWYLYPEAETAKKETRKKKFNPHSKLQLISKPPPSVSMTPSRKMSEANGGRWETVWSVYWEKLKDVNEQVEKKRQTESCDCSVLQRVSPSLSPWQVGNIGELWAARPTLLHRGFTRWQTEPRAVLSTAHHSLRACLTQSSPPSCVLHLHVHRK